MTLDDRVKRMRKFIMAERRMRETVFHRDPVKRAKKVAECDAALEDLEFIAAAIRPRPMTQTALF